MNRGELAARYGPGTMISVYAALEEAAAAGTTTIAKPGELFAVVHRDAEAADAWAEANRLEHGNPELCRHARESGEVLVIYDLRPQMRRLQEQENPVNPWSSYGRDVSW